MRLRQVPLILENIIHTALMACDGVRFRAGTYCPHCGGTLSRYDERKRRFALLIEDEKKIVVNVLIQRSYCHSCDRIIEPPAPFYPGTRIGAPVVDLCRSLSSVMPCTRASSYLEQMGVVVDRWSVRHYAQSPLPVCPSMDVFGMMIPVSIISLSTLAGSLQVTEKLDMETILEICNYSGRPGTNP